MIPGDSLAALRTHITDRLITASETRRGAWRTPVLSTIDADGAPSARTIVMRSVDPAARAIEIFTDFRSAKTSEIAADDRICLTFWDPVAAEQLRLGGTCRAVEDRTLVDAHWQAIGPRGRSLYGETGRQTFMVLRVDWFAWDWLWIGDVAHRRARFDWTPEGAVNTSWIDP